MTADGIISAIIIGAIIGALGRLVMPGRQSMPIWLTIVVGIIAALLGSVIANALGVQTTAGVDWIEIFIQVAARRDRRGRRRPAPRVVAA